MESPNAGPIYRTRGDNCVTSSPTGDLGQCIILGFNRTPLTGGPQDTFMITRGVTNRKYPQLKDLRKSKNQYVRGDLDKTPTLKVGTFDVCLDIFTLHEREVDSVTEVRRSVARRQSRRQPYHLPRSTYRPRSA